MLEIAMKEPPRYEFMLPKSKHYRYYISQLFEKGPNRGAISRGKAGQLVV